MIVTCSSCLTKYNLDDSKVKPKGVKVRCSRCKHVFWVVPPPETKEEVIEDFEAFAKYHEELIGPGEKEAQAPHEERVEEEERPSVEEKFIVEEKPKEEKIEEEVPSPEEEFLFGERPKLEEDRGVSISSVLEEEKKIEIPKPKKMPREERRIFPFILTGIIIIVLLGLAYFYFWGDIRSIKKVTDYLETPIKKVTDLWSRILGSEKEGLIIGNLNGYEEKVGEYSIFIIEGKINNQSRHAKRHVKLKISIFDRNKIKVAEKEVICGRILTREELKNLSPEFFKGDMVIKFKSEKESIIQSGKDAPFMAIFKDIPPSATEFSVEIVEAPNI